MNGVSRIDLIEVRRVLRPWCWLRGHTPIEVELDCLSCTVGGERVYVPTFFTMCERCRAALRRPG